MLEELKERCLQGAKDLVICNGVITSKHILPLLASPLLVMEEPLFSHPDDVPNKGSLNYICNSNHTLCNTQDFTLNVLLNYKSLLAKIAILSPFVHEHTSDILAISGTWLSPSITDTDLLLPNYNIFQKDRSDGYKGELMASLSL